LSVIPTINKEVERKTPRVERYLDVSIFDVTWLLVGTSSSRLINTEFNDKMKQQSESRIDYFFYFENQLVKNSIFYKQINKSIHTWSSFFPSFLPSF
jgi:hypothetical protein